MTKKQLEALVSGVKSPPLDRKETRKLLEEYPTEKSQQTFNNEVAQSVSHSYRQPVAQVVAQGVAQHKKKKVAQVVAQAPMVAQVVPQRVAQSKTKKVAQSRPQVVAQAKPKPVAYNRSKSVSVRVKDSQELLIEQDVNRLKDEIFQISGVENRKKFVRDIGWGIMPERRGKKQYLFGVKKLGGRKYKLYVGNATN